MLVWSEGAGVKGKSRLTAMGPHLHPVRHLGALVKMHLEGTHLRELGHLSPPAGHWMKLLAILFSLASLACGRKAGQWQLQARLTSHEKEEAEGMKINERCHLDFFFCAKYSRDNEEHDFRRMLTSGSVIDW